MNKKQPELLAPAGTPEAAWAALTYGTDAIYAGLPRFSARAEAGNFTTESLDEMIGYAHHLGRKVYVTFNTLVQERELGEALEMLSTINDLNADGVIVQDMGVARLAKKHFPKLRLHASTQLAAHNLAGAKHLAENGFSRVVLARELSLPEIEHITQNCGIETEVFIHGALCYSYSGLCLFSSHQLGRSGNRGRCAYSCRQPFQSDDSVEQLPFSMKDFSAAEHLEKLVQAGVSSLKVEGRMKGELYVAAVTDFYRQLIDGKLSSERQQELLSDIQTIFGRTSTDLYLKDRETNPVDSVNDGNRGAQIGTVKAVRDGWLTFHSNRALQKYDGLKVETERNHPFGFGADEMRYATDPAHKRKYELTANAEIALLLPRNAPHFKIGAPVYCSYSQAVRQNYRIETPRPGFYRQRRPVDIHISQSEERIELTASANCDGTTITQTHTIDGPFEAARQPEKSVAAFQRSFDKLGETDWILDALNIEASDAAVFVPASVLNEGRRQLMTVLSESWNQSRKPPEVDESFLANPVTDAESWSVKSRVFIENGDLEKVGEWILELDLSNLEELEKAQAAIPKEKLRLALPAIIHQDEIDAFRDLIASLPDQEKWEASNIGGLQLLSGKSDIIADWALYTLNTQAALQWKDQRVKQFILSPEDDAPNYCELVGKLTDAAVIPIYQYTPLMISATRPSAEGQNLSDRSSNSFRVEQSGRESVLVAETPFALVEHLDELKVYGARNFRIDVCYGFDRKEQMVDTIKEITNNHDAYGHAGNFARTLL